MRILMFYESILLTVMKAIGPSASYEDFRQEIINWINTAFAELRQIGVGPEEGFMITDEEAVWADFVEPVPRWAPVISYVSTKVKQRFDPPQAGTTSQAYEKILEEDVWRLSWEAEREGRND